MILTETHLAKKQGHIAKQEYHKYDILTYILQPGLSKIVQYVLFQKFILLQIAFH